MKITTDLLKTFKPCQDRLANWIEHYGDKKPSLRKFTQLVNINHADKIWVLIRLLSEENKVIFAIDMAVSAAQHATVAASAASAASADYAAYATGSALEASSTASAFYATHAATSAAYASANDAAITAYFASRTVFAASAAYTAAESKAQQEQLEILIYLIESQEK